MPDPFSSRRHVILASGLAGVIALGGLGLWWAQNKQSPPLPDSPQYTAAWTTWTNGLLALQTGDEKRAQAQLTRVTQLLPNDAAGHANLGLFFLRRGELDTAASHLERAVSLAPQNARIETLLALLESKRGDSVKTVKHLRRALELSPTSIKARYALARELERASDTNRGEVQKLLQQLSDARPNNRLATLELARVAAKQGDKAALQKAMSRLGKSMDSLPREVEEQLRATQKSVASNASDTATQLVFLTNVLAPVPTFVQDRLELETPPEQVGEPLEALLTLDAPRAAAAVPDDKISFRSQPLPGAAGQNWDAARVIYFDGAGAGSKGALSVPSVLALSSTELRRVDVKASAPLISFASMENSLDSLAVADWNNDFEPDVALASNKGVRLFTGRANGQFQDVTAQTRLPSTILKTSFSFVSPFDVEADGDLDFVLGSLTTGPIVLQNNTDGTFTVTRPFTGVKSVRASVLGDFDSDADCDIAFLDATGVLRVLSNERSGAFRPLPIQAPPSAAIGIADTDRDGVFDLVLWGLDGVIRRARVKTGDSPQISLLAKSFIPEQDTAQLFMGDFDLNGGLDILVSGLVSGQVKTQIFLSGESDAFEGSGLSVTLLVQEVADMNRDGRLDLIGLDRQGRATTMLGKGTKPYQFEIIRPRAKAITGDGRINSFALGGSVELRAGTLFQKQVITGPVVHFGIGSADAVNAARVLWPNGVAQAEFDLTPNQSILAEQRLSGSCPFLWAWNGRGTHFVKDCNWDSPLGLKINAQDTAGVVATEDWVKVRGDQLQPRNGMLELSLTADLWESHFFDLVSLLVVDHPTNREVWVDERFNVPIPPLRVEASGLLHPVKSARDDRGRDVSRTVQKLDGKYLDVERGRYQGVTREHFVELDLSDTPADVPLWLIAEGWVHPTDSSINVALGQGKHAPPQSLSVQVVNKRGEWRTARSNVGFPSGKNKAVTLDLSGLIKPGEPRRLRLATNLEIYWDRLSWATKDRAAAFKIQRLQPQVAQLRFRGFSQIEARDASSPELPRSYAPDAGVGQKWSDLIGFHTRWGDVRELTQKTDDRYVIMNAGDEMVLRFKSPAPPRAGWTRDYVFISDGWTKDGNLNTGLSKTLLPLPSHKTPFYPSQVTLLKDDPVYRRHSRDWQRFHTRYVAPKSFNSVLLPPENAAVVTTVRASEGATYQSVTPAQNLGEGSRVPVK